VYHADLQPFMRGRNGLWLWLGFFFGRLEYRSLSFTLSLGIGVGLRTRSYVSILFRLSPFPTLGLLLSDSLVHRSLSVCVLTDWMVILRIRSRRRFWRIGRAPLQFEFHISTKAKYEDGTILGRYNSTLKKRYV